MPIFRFESLDEADRAGWLPPGDPALEKRWEALYALSKLAPHCPPRRGVQKFRTIEEANLEREAWIAACVEAGKARVVSPPGAPSPTDRPKTG